MGLIFAIGAEEQVLSSNGTGLWNGITNSPTISSSQKKNGSYSYRFYQTGATSCYLSKTVSMGTSVCVSFYIYFITRPAGYCNLLTLNTGSTSPTIAFDSSNKLYYGFSGVGARYGTTVLNTGEWYRIDIKAVTSSGTQTLDVQVNGTDQGQYTATTASGTMTDFKIGADSAIAHEFFIDDLVVATSDLYPIGDHVCQYLKPDADGTHNAGTNTIEAQDGTDIGTTTAYDKINSTPTSAPSSTTYIKQSTLDTAKYAEVNMEDMTSGKTPIGLMGFLAYTSAATQANAASCYAYLSSTEYEIWGVSGTRRDYSDGSTSNLYYKSAVLGITLSESNVNATKIRLGHGGDINPVPYWIDTWFVVVYSTGGITQAIGLSSETDTALSVTINPKRRMPGVATETDTALAMTKEKEKYIGILTETDTALPITRRKTKVIGILTETDTPLAVLKRPSVGIVTETDTALPITRRKTKAIGILTETDSTYSFTRRKTKAVGIVTETDTPISFTRIKTKAVGIVTETDALYSITRNKLKSLGILTETDEALIIVPYKSGGTKIIPIGLVTEVDSALAILPRKTKTIGIITETDSPYSFTRRKSRAVGVLTETDATLAFLARKLKVAGIVTETDTSLAVLRSKLKSLGIVSEADLALAITVIKLGKTVSLLTATEIDEALPMGIILIPPPTPIGGRYIPRGLPPPRHTMSRTKADIGQPARSLTPAEEQTAEQSETQAEGPYVIQGKIAASKIEWNVAKALELMKIPYIYQYSVFGGRSQRGGTVIDFLVNTVPLPTPLYVQGDYWHGNRVKRQLDRWTMNRVRAALNYTAADPAQVWEKDCQTIESAKITVRKALRI